MTRKQWKIAVSPFLSSLCTKRGFSVTWTDKEAPAAKLEKGGKEIHIAPKGIWLIGTPSNGNILGNLIPFLTSSVSVLHREPLQLGSLIPRKQESGSWAIGCNVPDNPASLDALLDALDVIQASMP